MLLKEIAGAMWREATEKGRATRTLSGGLQLAVRVEGQRRYLGLCRGAERVAYDEAAICKAAFGVPARLWPEEIPLAGRLWKTYTWDSGEALQRGLFE